MLMAEVAVIQFAREPIQIQIQIHSISFNSGTCRAPITASLRPDGRCLIINLNYLQSKQNFSPTLNFQIQMQILEAGSMPLHRGHPRPDRFVSKPPFYGLSRALASLVRK